MIYKAQIWLGVLASVACFNASFAQTYRDDYPVNAVGYINIDLKPGFNLVAIQLIAPAADNSVGNVFNNMQGGVPDGTRVYVYENGVFQTAMYFASLEEWSGDAVPRPLGPGDGVIVYLPGAESKVLTIVGEIPEGEICTEIPHGSSIKSSVVPQAVKPDAVKNADGSSAAIPAAGGDAFFRYNTATKSFDSYRFDDFENAWVPPLPTINVGEAFYYLRAGAPTTWCRTFFVNNPG